MECIPLDITETCDEKPHNECLCHIRDISSLDVYYFSLENDWVVNAILSKFI